MGELGCAQLLGGENFVCLSARLFIPRQLAIFLATEVVLNMDEWIT